MSKCFKNTFFPKKIIRRKVNIFVFVMEWLAICAPRDTHCFSDGWYWPCAHDGWIKASLSPRDNPCHWFQTTPLSLWLAHEHSRCSPIIYSCGRESRHQIISTVEVAKMMKDKNFVSARLSCWATFRSEWTLGYLANQITLFYLPDALPAVTVPDPSFRK